MSKLNIYYICIFALIFVCVSGFSDLRKDQNKNPLKVVNHGPSSKLVDNSNEGEDLIVKKRINIDEERELDVTGSEDEPSGSTSSTADVTTTPAATGSTAPITESTGATTEPSDAGKTTPEATTTTSGGDDVNTNDGDEPQTTHPSTTPESTTTPEEEGTTGTEEEGTTPQATILDKLSCPFERTRYVYVKGDKKTINLRKLEENDSNITYTDITCNPIYEGIYYDNTTNVIVDTSVEYSGVCTIRCNAKGFSEGSSSFSISIVDYKAIGINPILSRVPAVVNLSKPFNVTLVLQYPSITDAQDIPEGKSITLNFDDVSKSDYNITQDGLGDVEELANNSTFRWDDLQINYNGDDTIYGLNPVTVNVKDNKLKSYENYTIKVNHDDNCTYSNGYDEEGLCCNRTYQGEYCTKIKATFTFNNNDGDFDSFKTAFVNGVNTITTGSPYFSQRIESESNGRVLSDTNAITLLVTYIEGGSNPYANRLSTRLLQGGIDWNSIFSDGKIDPIQFGTALLSIVGPSDKSDGTIEIPPELKGTPIGNALKDVVENKVVTDAVATITTVADEQGITKDPNNYFKSEATDEKAPDELEVKPFDNNSKPWAEEYWWVILIICIGAVLIIGIIVAILVVSLSSSGGSKTNKKDLEKSEKIMETVIPIEKIKQENEISDDDIYKPFSYEVIMEGYLLKSGRDRLVGKWQRRYCVLYFEPAVLRIYDSMVPSYYGKVYIDEKQSIPLDCYNGIEYKDGSNEFTLVLKVRDSSIKAFEAGDKERKIVMKVEGENSIETAKRWVECFRDFKNQKPKAGDAWTRPLIIDQNNGKISTSTNKAAEKKNEEIVLKAQQRRQAISNSN